MLGSIEAMRPVFMIVTGSVLLLVIWRLTERSAGAARKMLRTGAALLAFGYVIMTPLYEGRLIPAPPLAGRSSTHREMAEACHMARMIAMNVGWALAGLGLALHVRREREKQSPDSSTPRPAL